MNSWEDLKDKEDSLMRCSICNASALISQRTGQPYCPNWKSHKEDGDTRNHIELSETEYNFWGDLLEDMPNNHIKKYQQTKYKKHPTRSPKLPCNE